MGRSGHIDDSAWASSAEPSGRGTDVCEPLAYESLLPALPTSVSRMRWDLADALIREDVARERQGAMALVLTEAAANVVRHAYPEESPGPIYASAALTGHDLTISVIDFGRGMGSPSGNPGGGFGLLVMKEYSDGLRICANEPDAGTSVHALFERVWPAGTIHRSAEAAVERAEMLHEYSRVLRAAHASLRHDTEAVLAQASHALADARRRRRERGPIRR